MKCDICKKEIDGDDVKSVAAYETKYQNGVGIGWRKIFTKICCDKCYERINIEAGSSGVF
jgi:hypothetical protein